MSQNNIITPIRRDIAVFKAVVAADAPVTDMVVQGVWRWFSDVEIAVPLPVMALDEFERKSLVTSILDEMDTTFSEIEKRCEGASPSEQHEQTQGPDAERVNSLWRELAGCYAELVNSEVPNLPDEFKAEIYASMVENMCRQMDLDEDEVRHRLRTDSALRMSLRLAGLDPDKIN